MKSLNEVQLLGNLTRDPELKHTQGGDTVCTFGIATNRVWKDPNGNKQEQVEFHNCVAWGRAGEVIAQYVKKGHPLLVQGRLKTRTWDDEQSGKKMYRTEIIVENFVMLSQRRDGDAPEPRQSGDLNDNDAPPPPSEQVGDIF